MYYKFCVFNPTVIFVVNIMHVTTISCNKIPAFYGLILKKTKNFMDKSE